MNDEIWVEDTAYSREHCEKLTKASLLVLARAYFDERTKRLGRKDLDCGKEWLARSEGKKQAIIAYMFDRIHPPRS